MANAESKLKIVVDAQNNATAGLRSVTKELGSLEKQGSVVSSSLTAVKIASAAAAAALGAVGLNVVKAGASFQQTQIAFETMLGSAEVARKTLDDLSKFAASTPFELPQLEEASKRLLAYGTTAEDLLPTLRMLGDISAGVGMDKLPQLILAFGQVQAATKLTGAELRQFSEAGVPLLGALADKFGVTEAAVIEMVSAGTVGFEDMKTALGTLTAEGGKFNNLMEKQSTSLSGLWSNLQDQISLTSRAIGTELLPYLAPVIEKMIAFASSIRSAAEGFNGFGPIVQRFNELISAFDEKTLLITHLQGAFSSLGEMFKTMLKPALDELWIALQPLMPYLEALGQVAVGGLVIALHTLVAAFRVLSAVVVVALTGLTNIITFIVDTAVYGFRTLQNVIETVAAVFTGDWGGAITGIKNQIEDLISWVNNLIDAFKRAIDLAKEIGGGSIDFLKNLLPGRAKGGPVTANQTYMVGEQGPEIFRPATSGTIIPNNKLPSGGSSTNVYITGNTLLSDDVAVQIGDMFISRAKLSGQF